MFQKDGLAAGWTRGGHVKVVQQRDDGGWTKVVEEKRGKRRRDLSYLQDYGQGCKLHLNKGWFNIYGQESLSFEDITIYWNIYSWKYTVPEFPQTK